MSTAARGWRRVIPRIGRSPTAPAADSRTLIALATVLFLVQFPHVFHLPVWVSGVGGALVGLRLWLHREPHRRALRLLLSPITVTLIAATSALLLRFDYGYSLGRDPSVAFLFVLVAAKFAEIRRTSDATLLLCLSGFLLLTQYFYSQTILAALFSLPAVVAIAFALSILRDSTNPASNGAQLRFVAKLLVQGLPLAALLFFVFPRLPGPLWSLPEDAMATTGLSDSMSPGSIGSLSQSNDVAFRVEFDDAPPAPHRLYWRGPVLTEFDGRNWTVAEEIPESSPQRPANAGTRTDYTVMLQPHRQRWLFALDAAASVPTADTGATPDQNGAPIARPLGRYFADGQLIANTNVSQVLRYRQSSVLRDTLVPSRPPRPSTLHLPGKNPEAIAFAAALRSRTSSEHDYARHVLEHFHRDTFRYTLQPQVLGDAPVDEFLFKTKAGFCEHYAAAFVVLMRAADIPARVVTGYQGGEMNGDYMIVRQADAHAWAEAFIDGAWQRFDPTGFVSPSRVEQGISAALPTESALPGLARLQSGWLRSAQLQWDALNHQWQRLVVNFDNNSQKKLWDKLGFLNPSLLHIVLFVIGASLLWALFILGIPHRRHAHLSPDEQLWQRACRILANHRLPRQRNESASEYLHRAAQRWPSQRLRLRELDAAFTTLRFRRTEDAHATGVRARVQRELAHLAFGIALTRFSRRQAAQVASTESRVTAST
ncbi:MAG: DUF3488 and transglutaminase-like domain-containing protein [Pseudomonadota bacterium]